MAYHTLMIVESPNKAKTITKWVAKDGVRVMATFGHIRVLDTDKPREEVLNVEHGFKLKYKISPKSKDHVKEMVSIAKNVDTIILATDPDYEGEGISQAVVDVLKQNKVNPKNIYRVTYTEVTEKAVRDAIKQSIDNKRGIDNNKVAAQSARQALDYAVGFWISPILWKIFPSQGLSAGRVQSPSLRILATREKEIREFVPSTYWQVNAFTEKDNIGFATRLVRIGSDTISKMSLNDLDYVEKHKKALEELVANKEKLHVTDVKTSKVSRKPKPPYTTSTLQMDAVRKLGWNATRTMQVAQRLFEGSEVHGHGFITYMRTDSVSLSEEALNSIYRYGTQFYPNDVLDHPKQYASKNKSAQEAHEAIRPTDITITPDSVKAKFTPDEFKLYELIWQRTLASQMKPAIFDSTQVNLTFSKNYGFRANGSVLVFPGYLSVYQEGEEIDGEKDDNVRLPRLNAGDKLTVNEIQVSEHQTKPPARYNEASLVKVLEEYGIGRPSTYATIPKTLQDRGYITVEKNRITVTDMGIAVIDYLVDKFHTYVDYKFTSNMEADLDNIAQGHINREAMLFNFWNPFIENVKREETISIKHKGVIETTEEICPSCGQSNLVKMLGKFGNYLKCTHQGCKYTRSLAPKKEASEVKYIEGKSCPQCGSKIAIRKGFKGREFGSCTGYPNCKYSCNADGSEIVRHQNVNTGVKCPKCKKHYLSVRMGRFGKMVSCDGFTAKPKCSNIIRKEDLPKVLGKTEAEVEVLLK